MFGGGGGPGGPSGGPRRPPSQQELVAYTQSIMQKALLRQELEKAKEVGGPEGLMYAIIV